MFGSTKKASRSRGRDAALGSGVAAIIVVAATFGELGNGHHPSPPVMLGGVQTAAVHHAVKPKAPLRVHRPVSRIPR